MGWSSIVAKRNGEGTPAGKIIRAQLFCLLADEGPISVASRSEKELDF
jgi:hypothetical protein